MRARLKTAVLLSGAGRTLQNLLVCAQTENLPIAPQLVISSRADAYGLTIARAANLRTAVVESKKFRREGVPDWQAMAAALNAVLLPENFDLVLFAGFMCFYPLPEKLRGKALNIHPSLLPAFGGRGMYGRKVHEAVKAAGVKITGCTAHLVGDVYDGGEILAQGACALADGDSVDEIARKVFALECKIYPRAIRRFAGEKIAAAWLPADANQ